MPMMTEQLIIPLTDERLSDYELERGKPMPNLTHGALQLNIGFELKLNYGSQYRIASEVALATVPDGTTPDIVVYPQRTLNFVNEAAKQSEPPLLVIEIQSPSQSNRNAGPDFMIDKATQYFDFGVRSCWIVFPALKAVAVYSAPDQYAFFHHDDRLMDKKLQTEIELKKVFV